MTAERETARRERLLRLMQQTERLTGAGGWEFDVASGQATWTDETYRIFGVDPASHDPGDVAGNLRFYDDSSRQRLEAAFRACVERGEPYDLELDFTDASGRARRIRTTGQAEFQGGKVARVYGNLADITENHETTRALSQAHALLNGVLQSTPDIVVTRDLQGRVTFYNRAFEAVVQQLFGCAATVGMRTTDHLPAEARQHWEEVLARVQAGETHREEFSWHYAEDDRRIYELTMVPIRAQGQVVGTVEFNRDVTRARAMERQAADQQRLEAMGHISAGVSHEYNNLLMGILGYAHHLRRRTRQSGEARTMASMIIELSERAAEVSRQLLDFARPQTTPRSEQQIDALVRQTLETFQPLLGEDIALELDLRGEARLLADATQLQQVLVNLLLNAADAMPDGGSLRVATSLVESGPDLQQRLDLDPQGQYLCISVTDSGRGMDAATARRAMEPFFTTKPPGAGTGLGLSAAAGIVRGHGGALDLHSTPGQGTTISVFLPRLG